MNKMKRFAAVLLTVLVILSLAGCQNIENLVKSRLQRSSDKSGSGYNIYYLNQNGDGILGTAYQLTSTTEESIVDECMKALAEEPEKSVYRAVLTGPAAVENYKYDKQKKSLAIYFSESFELMPETSQLLTRAAVVKTMTQFRNIVDYVTIKIGGSWLTGANGEVLRMDRDFFVSEITNDLDLHEDARMTLYFLSENGRKLAAYEATQRYYNYSKDSLAAVVMDALLRGPVTDQYRSPLSSSIQVRSIHISDGLCTVDFNRAFLTPVENVPYKMTVYSVVSTLCALGTVNEVNITVEGETVTEAPEDVVLSGPMTPDTSLIEKRSE